MEADRIVRNDQAKAVASGGRIRPAEKLEPRRPMTMMVRPINNRGGHPPARKARDAQSPATQSAPRPSKRSIAARVATPRIMSSPAPAERSMTARQPNQATATQMAAR